MSAFSNLVAKAVGDVTKEWSNIKKREERDQRQAARLTDRYRRGVSLRTTIKEAAYRAIPDAYAKAAGGSGVAGARQVMYAARPFVQQWTGEFLDDAYFTQTLLPNYQRENPQKTADWDIVYDARGHFTEPHTQHRVDLGTVGVRDYLAGMRGDPDLDISLPELSSRFPTHGPADRYGAILYIEKEGFIPLLEKAGFAERYDLAIMSSKGMGTTSVRDLIGQLFDRVKILVLHDFDKSGFSIVGTLTRNTKRYSRAAGVRVIDLGLRLTDVETWKLQVEDVVYSSDPAQNLNLNGASSKEIQFLRGKHDGYRFRGQRVELNAFTSDDFVEWLESKLAEHQIRKVIPDGATLEAAYRRAASIQKYRSILRSARQQVEEYSSELEVPGNLGERVAEQLTCSPSSSWDQAMELILPNHEGLMP